MPLVWHNPRTAQPRIFLHNFVMTITQWRYRRKFEMVYMQGVCVHHFKINFQAFPAIFPKIAKQITCCQGAPSNMSSGQYSNCTIPTFNNLRRDYVLTLSQTTKFRLFQTERVCRWQFQIWWKWQKVFWMGRKQSGKRRNCSLWAISLYLHCFQKTCTADT